MQENIIKRSKIAKSARDYFYENGFIEIETPMMIKSTPEGARDYLVPSRIHNGKFYALPQSPQIYKQLLMIAGFDRYIQLARCFRDEDLRADRQPEFTQIDLEMSFVDVEDVLEMVEGFVKRIFNDVLEIDIPTPLPRMTYKEAMEIILDWAVEIPAYQRQDATVISSERVNIDSVAKDMTPYYGWMAEIETISMN